MDNAQKNQLVDYWRENAADAFDTAETLYVSEKYHHALFFVQLAVEGMVKAYVVSVSDDYPLPIHDLVKLLTKAGLSLTEKQKDELNTMSSFNLEARYPKDKKKLYEKATRTYTREWLDVGKEYMRWLETQLQNRY